MKYDKYGDPIVEELSEVGSKTKTAFLIMALVQLLLVAFNIAILVIPTLNLYLCFITAPIFMFMYITFLKGYSAQKDNAVLPGYCKATKILSPVLYGLTMALAILSGM